MTQRMKTKQKVSVLIEALPYIRKYYRKIVVIKYGGKAMEKSKVRRSIMTDVVLLKHVGIYPVVVHGGGPEINEAMEAAKLAPKFVNGLRVTDEATMAIVEDVFWKINKEICGMIKKAGGSPVGISGRDHRLIEVIQKNKRLGYVGEIKHIHPEIVTSLIKENYIPVISPIGIGPDNQVYNINADTAASYLATALEAEKLTILTDVDGVYYKRKLVSNLSIRDARRKIRRGVIRTGMIPKVEACIRAVRNGCRKAHLINGTFRHGLLLEIFTDTGIGTELVKSYTHH